MSAYRIGVGLPELRVARVNMNTSIKPRDTWSVECRAHFVRARSSSQQTAETLRPGTNRSQIKIASLPDVTGRHADRLREPDSTTLWYLLQIGPEVEQIR